MRNLNLYQIAVVAAHPQASLITTVFSGPVDIAEGLEPFEATDPYLVEALDVIPNDCEYPDDASAALTALANRLQAECEADRKAPDWASKAIAMGWVRTAAAGVWRAADRQAIEHTKLQ